MSSIQRDLGLQSIRVSKVDLIEKLKVNLEKHRELYEAALIGYKEDVKIQLNKLLADVEAGKRIRASISFDEPKCHSEDYETVLEMLEMSVDEYIDLSMIEFRQYVQDKWNWKEAFVMTSNKYLNM